MAAGRSRDGGPVHDTGPQHLIFDLHFLSKAKKNGFPWVSSGEVTASGLGCTSPAASSARRRLSLLITITSAATIRANYMHVKHFLAPMPQLASYAMRLSLNYKILRLFE